MNSGEHEMMGLAPYGAPRVVRPGQPPAQGASCRGPDFSESGRMEHGPRALGARSIPGDARSPAMQTALDLGIKSRESFRPFRRQVLALSEAFCDGQGALRVATGPARASATWSRSAEPRPPRQLPRRPRPNGSRSRSM